MPGLTSQSTVQQGARLGTISAVPLCPRQDLFLLTEGPLHGQKKWDGHPMAWCTMVVHQRLLFQALSDWLAEPLHQIHAEHYLHLMVFHLILGTRQKRNA